MNGKLCNVPSLIIITSSFFLLLFGLKLPTRMKREKAGKVVKICLEQLGSSLRGTQEKHVLKRW